MKSSMPRFFLVIDFLLCVAIVALVLICYERDKNQARQVVREVLDARQPAEEKLSIEQQAATEEQPPREPPAGPARKTSLGADPFAPPGFDPFAPPGEQPPEGIIPFEDLRTLGDEEPRDRRPEPLREPTRLLLLASPPGGQLRTGREAIEKALDEPITAEFDDVSCRDAIDAVGERCNVKIEVDPTLPDMLPMRYSCVRLPLRDALTEMLAESGLSWTIRDGAVFVTDNEKLAPAFETKVYAVGDLAAVRDESGGVTYNVDSIAEAVAACVRPGSWDTASGEGKISAAAIGNVRALIVRQTPEVHAEIEAFLARLRRIAGGKPDEPEDSPRRKLDKALAGAVSVDFTDTPLDEALAELAEQSGAEIVLDPRLAVGSDTRRERRVTTRLSEISLRAALRLILRDLDLAYGVRRDVIIVSTPKRLEEEAGRELYVRFYPVGDLVGSDDATGRLQDLCDLSWMCCARVHALSSDKLQLLVVRQTDEVHENIAELLVGLRHIAKETAAGRKDACWPRYPGATTEAGIAASDALLKPVTFEFDEMPLADLPAVIRDQCRINAVLDRKALSDVGVGDDTPITKDLKGVSLRSALTLILRELDLTYLVEDGALVITTPEEAETRLSGRIYSVAGLVDRLMRKSDGTLDYDSLVDLITWTIQPTCWDTCGGPGSMHVADFKNVRAIIASQTMENHEEIEDLLAALRRVVKRADEDPADVACDWVGGRGKAVEAIERALAGAVPLDFKETPLSDVVDYLKDYCGIEIQIDKKALDDVGVGTDTPITLTVNDISLRSAFHLVLRQHDLCHIVQDEVLLVATPEEAEIRLSARLYPVTDLLGPVSDLPGEKEWEGASMTELITGTAHPTTWDCVGGPGSIAGLGFDKALVLVVSQTQETHKEVASLLAAIRRAVKLVEQGKTTPVFADPQQGSDGAEAVRRALAKNVSLEVENTSLAEAVAELGKQAGVNILFDQGALTVKNIREVLEDVDVWPDRKISIRAKNVPLRAALKQLLEPLDLTAVVCCEALIITSPDEAETCITTAVYPIGDLIVCRDENDELWYDFDTLCEVITAILEPATTGSARVGGPGSIAGVSLAKARLLVVSQTDEVHHTINDLLAKLRAAAEKGPGDAKPPRRKRPPKPKPMELPAGASQGGGMGMF